MKQLYQKKIQIYKDDFKRYLINNTKTSIDGFEDVLTYIFASDGKLIRPVLGMLIANNLNDKVNEKQNIFLQSIELIHNATLFHDDVIDNAKIRRNKNTLCEEFSNKIAILTGDYFLSTAIRNIYALNNQQINALFSSSMKQICEGELMQQYSLYKIISIEKYIEKTIKKTALLFELTTSGCALLSENFDKKKTELYKSIGRNFGIVFQIQDDINNFKSKTDKPVLNDLSEGIITAPIIFLAQTNKNICNLIEKKDFQKIYELLNKSDAMEKTIQLSDKYKKDLIDAVNLLPDNIYKDMLNDLFSEF